MQRNVLFNGANVPPLNSTGDLFNDANVPLKSTGDPFKSTNVPFFSKAINKKTNYLINKTRQNQTVCQMSELAFKKAFHAVSFLEAQLQSSL